MIGAGTTGQGAGAEQTSSVLKTTAKCGGQEGSGGIAGESGAKTIAQRRSGQ